MRVLMLILVASPVSAGEVIKLWPGKAPNEPAKPLPAEVITPASDKGVLKITNVSEPRLELFPAAKPNGTWILVAPGGGYSVVCAEHEGSDVAKWLNSKGISAAVLTYRVPRRDGVVPDFQPMVQDAQRAMGILRSKYKDAKIGMLGFSAGGHLTASTSTMFEKRMYEMIDDADKLSSRPDFAVLIYPGGIVEKDTATLKPDFKVSKDTPPMLFIHASDDKVASENSVAMYRELVKHKVPAEIHFYASGGHGFAMKGTGPVSGWPQRCEEWLALRGVK